jgi:hypothetical protein
MRSGTGAERMTFNMNSIPGFDGCRCIEPHSPDQRREGLDHRGDGTAAIGFAVENNERARVPA